LTNTHFRPGRNVTRSVCLSACVSVGHVHQPCENGWTDRDDVCVADSCGPKEARKHLLDGVKVRRIHLPPWGVTLWKCGLSSQFLTTCYFIAAAAAASAELRLNKARGNIC